jgi:hypothetical protein
VKVKISLAICSGRYATCSAVERVFEGKTHFAAPNRKNNASLHLPREGVITSRMSLMRASIRAGWICATLLLCAEKWNAFAGAWMDRPVNIAADKVQPDSGYAYETKLSHAVVVQRTGLNRIYLSEDGREIAHFSPRLTSVREVGRGIFAIQNETNLVFSALYCFAGRIPFWFGNCLDSIVSGKELPA